MRVIDLMRGLLLQGSRTTVLVDKHVTATASEARDLMELAKMKGRVLYPYQNCRFNADFLALRQLLELRADHPKSLGTLFEFESRSVACPTFHVYMHVVTQHPIWQV